MYKIESPECGDRVFCLEFNCGAIVEHIHKDEDETLYDLRLERRKNQSAVLVKCKRHDFIYPPPFMVNTRRRLIDE